MWRIGFCFLLVVLLVASLVGVVSRPASAGAFLLPEGEGQLIGGVGYIASSRRFDAVGTAMPAPTYRKVEASGYLEYGLTPSLSLIAAPTLARQSGTVAANTVTGSDSSAFGGRISLVSWTSGVVALQALVQPPLDDSQASAIADGGARSFAVDLRVPVGWSFRLLGLPAFLDVQPGVRLRAEPFPTEARLDLALGVRPIPRLMMLLQDFTSFAHSSGPLIAREGYSKGQASLVYDLTVKWSAQLGVFRTLAGRNAIRETGPLGALWYRF